MNLRFDRIALRLRVSAVRFVFAASLTAGCLFAFPLLAQPQWQPGQQRIEAEPQNNRDAATRPTLPEQRAAIVERLEERARRLGELEESLAEGEHAPESLTHEVELLKKLVLVLDRLSTLENENQQHLDARDRSRKELEDLRTLGLTDEPPYSYKLVDQLQDEIHTEQTGIAIIQTEVESASEALGRAKQWHEKTESRRRLAQESIETATEESNKGQLESELRIAKLEDQLASERVRLREQQSQQHQLLRETTELKLVYLQERLQLVAAHAIFTNSDLEQALVDLSVEEQHLAQVIQQRTTQIVQNEARLVEALDQDTTNRIVEQEILTVRTRSRVLQTQVQLLNENLQRIAEKRRIWKRRFDVANNTATSELLATWREESLRMADELQQQARLQNARISQVRSEFATVDTKLQGADETDKDYRKWLELQAGDLQTLAKFIESDLVSIEAHRRLHEKLLDEMDNETAAETAAAFVDKSRRQLDRIWNYELSKVDQKPITVKKVTTGLVLMVLGYYLSKLLALCFGRFLLPRFGVNRSAAIPLQSIAFYLLVCTSTLFALRFVNVPLTAFTVLGGALAIGFGFGSQTIASNFISGLILLAERPVRVGDTIEVNGLFGTVDHVGARSTRLRTATNLEILVPNSAFLENSVVNWTLTDDRVRTSVSVGVAYGSPTKEVERALNRAAEEHTKVLANPPPFVLFKQFGDSSLDFELHFWLRMFSHTERLRIESDIRHEVDRQLREAGVTIAFPQCDVHLDASQPIMLQMARERRAQPTRLRDAG